MAVNYPQGIFLYDGVKQPLEGDFTFGQGITPSVARLVIAPQATPIPPVGTLRVVFGRTEIVFPGCKVDDPSVSRDINNGQILSFSLKDRRWQWQFGAIHGRYNVKRADGTVNTQQSQEKTPKQLAKILLDEMKESGYDVSQLPDGTWRPEKIWNGANPAEELAELCDFLGCRVVLGLNNRVRIVKKGVGAFLPEHPSRQTGDLGVQVSDRPSAIRLECGTTKYQLKFKLKAVGLDLDGLWEPINKLSYMPLGGWKNEDPETFSGVTDRAARRLALKTVHRCFQIDTLADGTTKIPEFPIARLKHIRSVLPLNGQLLQEQLNRERDTDDLLTEHRLPCYLEGVFLLKDYAYGNSDETADIEGGAESDDLGNTYVGTRYVGGFSLDEAKGIVTLNDWAVKMSINDSGGFYEPAELYLTCTCSVKHPETFLPYRYQYTRELAGAAPGAGVHVIQAEDIYQTVRAEYGKNAKRIKSTVTNVKDKLDKWSKELLDAAEAGYQSPITAQAQYAGFLPINLDGAIQQVSWSFGSQAITRASRNTEFDLVLPNFKQLREQEKVKALAGGFLIEPKIVGGR